MNRQKSDSETIISRTMLSEYKRRKDLAIKVLFFILHISQELDKFFTEDELEEF